MTNPQDRVRPRPSERFAPPEDEVNLQAAADWLWQEPYAGQHGHRQMALFRHGPATVALYCFEEGSALPDHVVDGSVLIQVLKGRLIVRTDAAQHELAGGDMLRLAPGVKHDVEARDHSEMLMTVCLEGPNSHR